MADYRCEFQKMCDQWDSALKKGIFKTNSQPTSTSNQQDVPSDANYGMTPQMAAVAANSENINDADYWNAIFRLSRGEQVDLHTTSNPEVLREELTIKSKGKNANPIPRWSRGKDQANVPAHWFDRDDFDKLIRMKEDLHKLGDKLATHDGKAEKTQAEAVLKKIRNLQKQIDELSSELLLPREEKKS